MCFLSGLDSNWSVALDGFNYVDELTLDLPDFLLEEFGLLSAIFAVFEGLVDCYEGGFGE